MVHDLSLNGSEPITQNSSWHFRHQRWHLRWSNHTPKIISCGFDLKWKPVTWGWLSVLLVGSWVFLFFVSGLEAHSAPSQTARSLKPTEAMDSTKLQQLQDLMREARETGELEPSLAAASVFPVPKRSSRKNVPLAEHNRAMAGMAKPAGTPAMAKGSALLANVPASSNAPPMTQGPIPQMSGSTSNQAGFYCDDKSRDVTGHQQHKIITWAWWPCTLCKWSWHAKGPRRPSFTAIHWVSWINRRSQKLWQHQVTNLNLHGSLVQAIVQLVMWRMITMVAAKGTGSLGSQYSCHCTQLSLKPRMKMSRSQSSCLFKHRGQCPMHPRDNVPQEVPCFRNTWKNSIVENGKLLNWNKLMDRWCTAPVAWSDGWSCWYWTWTFSNKCPRRWASSHGEFTLPDWCPFIFGMGKDYGSVWYHNAHNAWWIILCSGTWSWGTLCVLSQVGEKPSWAEKCSGKGLCEISCSERTILSAPWKMMYSTELRQQQRRRPKQLLHMSRFRWFQVQELEGSIWIPMSTPRWMIPGMSEFWIGGLHWIHLAWYEARVELFFAGWTSSGVWTMYWYLAMFYGGITMGRYVWYGYEGIWSMQAFEFNNDECISVWWFTLIWQLYSYSSKGGAKFWWLYVTM